MEPIIRDFRHHVFCNRQLDGYLFREAIPIMNGFDVIIALFQENTTCQVRLPNGQYGLHQAMNFTFYFLEAWYGREHYFQGQSHVTIQRCGIPGTANHVAEIKLTGKTHTAVPYVLNATVHVNEFPTQNFPSSTQPSVSSPA